MSTKIFVNLPVKDLPRSMEFFTALGFTFDPRFTNDKAACLVISDDIYAMLLVEPFFMTFTPKRIADAVASTEAIMALQLESRARVDELADLAHTAGASRVRDPDDQGFMYSRSFGDPDGHIWELFYMNPPAT